VENEDVSAYDELIALLAQLAVPKVEPLCVPMNEPVNEPVLTLNVIEVAAEDVSAYEAEVTVPFTNEAVVANEAVAAKDDVRA
jgi:hypothetical protein